MYRLFKIIINYFNDLLYYIRRNKKIYFYNTLDNNVYWVYAVNLNPSFGINRDELMRKLKNEGIETRTFFCSMSDQPCLKKIKGFRKIRTPIASRIWKTGLYLPSSHTLSDKTIEFISKKIKKIQKNS